LAGVEAERRADRPSGNLRSRPRAGLWWG